MCSAIEDDFASEAKFKRTMKSYFPSPPTLPACEGKQYIFGSSYTEMQQEAYATDLKSVIWFTYRSGFPTMLPYSVNSDSGWGCMLRCAQMLLAQGLQRHYLGRNFRWPSSVDGRSGDHKFRTMVGWFSDFPGLRHPYSIHNVCQVGMKFNKLPCEWYGPGEAAWTMRELFNVHLSLTGGDGPSMLNPKCPPLKYHVTNGGTVYESELDELAKVRCDLSRSDKSGGDVGEGDPLQREPDSPPIWDYGVLLMVIVRLGLYGFNSEYEPALVRLLRMKISLGYLGGRPNHAMYFIGTNGDKLTCLDPHTTQSALADENGIDEAYCETTICKYPAEMEFDRLDPSLCLAFHLRTRDDLDSLKAELKKLKESGKDLPFYIEAAPTNYEGIGTFAAEDEGHSEGDVEDSYVLV
mmetsp:Transcript_17740/g.26281  ORF Transcript_17740/g.26281 Transcript_17740/m.26281 type:complete len:408 (-) Transcript_17740:119-1342(-)